MKILIKNGRLIDPASGLDCIGDLAIADGHVLALGDVSRDFTPERVIDATGGHSDVGQFIPAGHGIDDAPVADQQLHAAFPAMVDITAMRTAIPKVTCGRITLWLPSATAESISTPRLIGPGCITIASGLASASFSGVRP